MSAAVLQERESPDVMGVIDRRVRSDPLAVQEDTETRRARVGDVDVAEEGERTWTQADFDEITIELPAPKL